VGLVEGLAGRWNDVGGGRQAGEVAVNLDEVLMEQWMSQQQRNIRLTHTPLYCNSGSRVKDRPNRYVMGWSCSCKL
jgi:hypothetical protein